MGKPELLKSYFEKLCAEITEHESGKRESAGSDAERLVRRWVEEYAELLPEHKTRHPFRALKLLAAWTRLHRANKDLLGRLAKREVPSGIDLDRRWSELLELGATRRAEEEGFHTRRAVLAEAAIEAIRPLEWLRRVDRADEQDIDDEHVWIGLLEELDAMELSHWAAARVLERKSHPYLTRKWHLLLVAREGLRQRAAAFLPAWQWAQAFVDAVDFETGDEELTATIEKAVPVLEHAVRFQKAERGSEEQGRPLDPRLARLIRATALAAWRNERLLDLLKTLQQSHRNEQVALAADVASEGEQVDLLELRWASPDDQYRAYVDLPVTPMAESSTDVLPVRLAHAIRRGPVVVPGRPTTDFDGEVARLAGVLARVEPGGLLKFSVLQLRAALEKGELAVLEVGEGAKLQTWLPVLPSR